MALQIKGFGSPTLITTTADVIANAYVLLNQSNVYSDASSGDAGTAAMRLFNQLSYADIGKNNWRFATKVETLTQVANFTPPDLSPFSTAYYLPSDFIRLYRLIPGGINYDIFGKQIWTYSFPQLQCEYTAWVPVSHWPAY